MPSIALGRVKSILPDNAVKGVTTSWIGTSTGTHGERRHRCYNAVGWDGKHKSVCNQIHYTRGLTGYTMKTRTATDGTVGYLFKPPAYTLAAPLTPRQEAIAVSQFMYGLVASTRQADLLAERTVNLAAIRTLTLKAGNNKPKPGFTTGGSGDDEDPGGIGNTPGEQWGRFNWDEWGNVYAGVDGGVDLNRSSSYEIPVDNGREPIEWDAGYPNTPDETANNPNEFPDVVSDDVLTNMSGAGGKLTSYFCSPPPLPVCIVNGPGVTAKIPSLPAIDLFIAWKIALNQIFPPPQSDPDENADTRKKKFQQCMAGWLAGFTLCNAEATSAPDGTHQAVFKKCAAKVQAAYDACIAAPYTPLPGD